MFTQPGIITQHETIPEAIQFQETGYISVSEESYRDSKITFSIATPTEQIVLIPKYLSDNNLLFLSINHENTLHIGGLVEDNEKIYGDIQINVLEGINELTVLSNNTHFTVLFNGEIVFKFDSALFATGQVRIYGELNEIFYSCKIEEPQSLGWTTNGQTDGGEMKQVEIDDQKYMKLKGTATSKADLFQVVHLDSVIYSLSFTTQGIGRCYLKDPSDVIVQELSINEDELQRKHLTFEIEKEDDFELHFESDQELIIGTIQIEERVTETGYIENDSLNDMATRTHSRLIYPLKETFPDRSGSLYLKVTAPDGFDEAATIEQAQTIFKTDSDEVFVTYQNSTFNFTISTETISIPCSLSDIQTAELLISWNERVMSLTVNEETVTNQDAPFLEKAVKNLIFADEGFIQEPMILEEWALFHNQLNTLLDIQQNLPQAIMYSLFDGGISGQNVTWAEIPVAPMDHSPILVQKANGETLQKVSFFNFETGEYQTWAKEPFVYDGRSDFVEVAYADLNEQFRDISICTEDGEKIAEPYFIEGKRFNFSLSSNEKWSYKNKTLYAIYQVNDTYTIDYNIKAVDGYRINFAKHDGGERVIYQEGNRYGEPTKLATMIDMNPLQNQNHEGFLYVTNTVNKTDSFRITATPDRLPADGSSYSTLIIEPLDYQGNFLSHSNLEIIADKGFIARHISIDAVEAQKRSGQYLYQYVAPYIQSSVVGEVIEDYIWIVDQDNHIGIGYKILLSPVTEPTLKQLTKDEKNLLTAKTELINYILMYEGIEKYEDETLVNILDLNQDGRINTDEVLVLETNERDSELTVILNQLHEWEVTANATTTA